MRITSDPAASVYRGNTIALVGVTADWMTNHPGPLCRRRRPCGPACEQYFRTRAALRRGVDDQMRSLPRVQRLVLDAFVGVVWGYTVRSLRRRRRTPRHHSG